MKRASFLIGILVSAVALGATENNGPDVKKHLDKFLACTATELSRQDKGDSLSTPEQIKTLEKLCRKGLPATLAQTVKFSVLKQRVFGSSVFYELEARSEAVQARVVATGGGYGATRERLAPEKKQKQPSSPTKDSISCRLPEDTAPLTKKELKTIGVDTVMTSGFYTGEDDSCFPPQNQDFDKFGYGFQRNASGKCVRKCKPGKVFIFGQCLSCEDAMKNPFSFGLASTNEKPQMRWKTTADSNYCYTEDGCLFGYDKVGGECVPPCMPDYERASGGRCVPTEEYCENETTTFRDADWSAISELSGKHLGTCDGAQLTNIAESLRDDMDDMLSNQIEQCKKKRLEFLQMPEPAESQGFGPSSEFSASTLQFFDSGLMKASWEIRPFFQRVIDECGEIKAGEDNSFITLRIPAYAMNASGTGTYGVNYGVYGGGMGGFGGGMGYPGGGFYGGGMGGFGGYPSPSASSSPPGAF